MGHYEKWKWLVFSMWHYVPHLVLWNGIKREYGCHIWWRITLKSSSRVDMSVYRLLKLAKEMFVRAVAQFVSGWNTFGRNLCWCEGS